MGAVKQRYKYRVYLSAGRCFNGSKRREGWLQSEDIGSARITGKDEGDYPHSTYRRNSSICVTPPTPLRGMGIEKYPSSIPFPPRLFC